MKKVITLLTIGLFATSINAQDLPKPSPSAKIDQTVGLTNFSIEYSRPSVKGRTVFGDLVPFDKVWRLGANKCTQFTTSTDVMIEGTTLPVGTYAVFATPTKSGDWTIVFNSDTEQWGTGKYDAKKNIVAIKVKAVKNSFNETLTIGFNNLTSNSGAISIEWDNLKVDVPFTVNTNKIAGENIAAAIEKGEKLGDVYSNAANYYMGAKDNKKASMYIEKSIDLGKTHKNVFMKAKISKEMGKKDEAIKLAKEAIKLAEKADSKGWADYITETVESWSK
jgi:tetratricopeptide (TPR) repeat protein